MSSDVVYSAVRAHFTANWTATVVIWDNEASQPPNPASVSSWLFITEDDSDFDQISIGSGSSATELWRETGAVLIRINVKQGTGLLLASQLVTQVRTFLLGLELPGAIRFDSMPTVGRGQHEDGNWYGIWLRAGWTRN